MNEHVLRADVTATVVLRSRVSWTPILKGGGTHAGESQSAHTWLGSRESKGSRQVYLGLSRLRIQRGSAPRLGRGVRSAIRTANVEQSPNEFRPRGIRLEEAGIDRRAADDLVSRPELRRGSREPASRRKGSISYSPLVRCCAVDGRPADLPASCTPYGRLIFSAGWAGKTKRHRGEKRTTDDVVSGRFSCSLGRRGSPSRSQRCLPQTLETRLK